MARVPIVEISVSLDGLIDNVKFRSSIAAICK